MFTKGLSVTPPDSSGLWFGDDFGSDGWEFESLRARRVSAGLMSRSAQEGVLSEILDRCLLRRRALGPNRICELDQRTGESSNRISQLERTGKAIWYWQKPIQSLKFR